MRVVLLDECGCVGSAPLVPLALIRLTCTSVENIMCVIFLALYDILELSDTVVSVTCCLDISISSFRR